MLNPNSLARIVSEISAFIQTDRLLPVTYFPTNIVYPFTLRATGINVFNIRKVILNLAVTAGNEISESCLLMLFVHFCCYWFIPTISHNDLID